MIKDTLKAAHEALEQTMSKRHYNKFYRGMLGYPDNVTEGVWIILNRKPTRDSNCVVVYEAGVLGPYPDFEEGYSRRAEEELSFMSQVSAR